VLRHNEVMTPGIMKMSLTGHNGDQNAVVHQVLGSLVMKAVMHHRHELELHLFWHVEPLKVNMHKLPQTAIELSRQQYITVVDARSNEGMNQRRS